jgi:hypothetical protein
LNHLRVKRVSPRISPTGGINVTSGAGAASDAQHGASDGAGGERDNSRQRPTDLAMLPTGAKRAEMFRNLERAPEIIPLFDENQIEEKGLKGRAARYIMTAGQLFVNMRYPAIDEMRTQLEAEYADTRDSETMRSLVKQLAEQTMIVRIGRTVVYALAKQLNKEWDQKALDTASSPESLSMAADDAITTRCKTSDAQSERLCASLVVERIPWGPRLPERGSAVLNPSPTASPASWPPTPPWTNASKPLSATPVRWMRALRTKPRRWARNNVCPCARNGRSAHPSRLLRLRPERMNRPDPDEFGRGMHRMTATRCAGKATAHR